MHKPVCILLLFFGINLPSIAQQKKRVLFIGNSYIATNNLPQMLRNMALTAGDTLEFDSHTPGGFRFLQHAANPTTMSKIQAGNWDYVVLQEQSQLPSFPISQVQNEVFPYARMLDSMIKVHNPCAETMFYNTWGRKNGDASNCSNWPPVCTYQGMDSLLALRYRMMAEDNNAVIAPAAQVWRFIRDNHADIELFQADGSHPSTAGTYAVACAFYTTIFRKPANSITTTAGINAAQAAMIRAASDTIVYQQMSDWLIGAYDPIANFNVTIDARTLSCNNLSEFANLFSWYFGDGFSSNEESPVHTYTVDGVYTITLQAARCGKISIDSAQIEIISTAAQTQIQPNRCLIFPNPARETLTISVNNDRLGHFQVFDIAGRSVLEGYSAHTELSINVADLQPGIYSIILSDRNYKSKFVVSKQTY
ncbi:MAG: T9SS type A sorting domain-containing protein [Flavobacteriales bacterium]